MNYKLEVLERIRDASGKDVGSWMCSITPAPNTGSDRFALDEALIPEECREKGKLLEMTINPIAKTVYRSAKAVTFEMTEKEFREASNNREGRCIACGSEVDNGIEPDARNYKCDVCGQNQVFGMEELMFDALVSFVVEDND